jgi:hypothetical protein
MNREPNLRVVFFHTDAGNEPVQEWFRSLERQKSDWWGYTIGAISLALKDARR